MSKAKAKNSAEEMSSPTSVDQLHFRVLLLDDEEGAQVVLRGAFERLDGVVLDEVTCCATCGEALGALDDHVYDLAVLDYHLKGETSEALIERLAGCPAAPPVIAIASAGDAYLSAALTRAGAHRYLEKSDIDSPRFEEAVHSTVQFGRERRKRLAQQDEAMQCLDELTPREREVAHLISQGLLSKQIAAQLDCCTGTVNLHRSHLMHKTGSQSVADLVRLVLRAEPPIQ
ncbi:MAG: LuxR C-terminal-related transcriptional regulator [Algisphaera sp.]